MNAFSSNRFNRYSDVSDFYPPAIADCNYNNGPYLNKELRGELLESEFDSYSDVSVNTSSASTEYAKWKMQGNQSCYSPPSLMDDSFMYGSSGREDAATFSPYELREPSRASSCSDDEINELFPLDPTVLRHSKTMDEQEEMRYLQDVVQGKYYDEYHPSSTHDDPYWNMELAQEAGADFFPSDTLSWNALCAEERLVREQLLNEGEILKANVFEMLQQPATQSVYQMLQQSAPNLHRSQPHFTGDTKHTEAHQNGKRDHHPKEALSTLALHDAKPLPPPASDGDQRVFLGGLPLGITERALRQQLAAHGYKVLKRPKILRGFAPEVLMRSVQEAKELVERGKIMLNGLQVEVRPFNSFMKQSESKKIPNIEKRSVFLGGLPTGTTVNDIQNVFMKMDIRIMNYPVVKFGFARQVILENVLQAKTLIQKKKILIRGTFVDVRPFANQPRRRKSH